MKNIYKDYLYDYNAKGGFSVPAVGMASMCTLYIANNVANPAHFDLQDKEISFEELKQYPIMMLSRQSTTSEFLHNLFIQHQLELVPEIELNSNDLLIDLARIGLGIAFIPDYCLEKNPADLFTVKTKEKMPARQMVASINSSFPVSASTEEFLKLLPEV